MKYLDPFSELFNICIQEERNRNINILQGRGNVQPLSVLIDYFRDNKSDKTQMYLSKLSQFIEEVDFQNYIINLKKNRINEENKYLEIKIKKGLQYISSCKLACNKKILEFIDWEWIKINIYECTANFIPIIISDWKILPLDIMYRDYKKKTIDIFAYSPKNNLSDFYSSKGLNIGMENNYGLFPVLSDFSLKSNGLPKIYDSKNDTHIIIKFLSNDFVRYLSELRSKYDFDIAFRPDYDLVGEHIKDISLILEGVIRGEIFNTHISQLPQLSELIDYNTPGNKLIIQKTENDLTFEELVDDFETHDDTIVTQVVHLQYEKKYGVEYIKHIDHEYVFYSLDVYCTKNNQPITKGNARKRFKTFKIDKAQIEFTYDVNSNIVFQTLKAFFKNDTLINEYFEKMISHSS